jgi:hypothetical protein
MAKEIEDSKPGASLDVLKTRISLDLSVNDLRIIVGCFRGIACQMKADDEPFLDVDGVKLKERLESLYTEEVEKKAKARPPR